MPLRDLPEVFGQHASADAAMYALEATALLSGLAAMQHVPSATVADAASSGTRLLAVAAMLLEQAQHPPAVTRTPRHSMAGGCPQCMLNQSSVFFLAMLSST